MFSRKTATLVALLFFMVLFAVIVSISARSKANPPAAARAVLAVVSPCQEAAFRFTSFFVSIWDNYFFLVTASRENTRLSRKLDLALGEINRTRAAIYENKRLKAQLALKDDLAYTTVSAKVVGEGPGRWFLSLVIDCGKADGVLPGFPVVTPAGLVGRVIQASDHYSLVVPISDPNHSVDGRVLRTRARGVVTGAREAGCRFLYVTRKEVIRPGDTVVTTGLDRLFPPGLALGTVSQVSMMGEGMFQEITITPMVNFRKVEEVLVIFSALALPTWETS